MSIGKCINGTKTRDGINGDLRTKKTVFLRESIP